MQIKTKFFMLFLFSLLIFTISCEKNPMYPGSNEYIVGEYSFSNGELLFQVIDQSKYIEFDSSSVINNGDGSIGISLHGVIISSNKYNYEVEEFAISECDAGGNCSKSDFSVKSEFNSDQSSVKTDVIAVLVLDLSASLSNNVSDIKAYAMDFAQSIVGNTDSSYVGIVLFSKDVVYVPFQNKDGIQILQDSITNYTQYENRTTLYAACQIGLDMLDSTKHEGKKTLVIFTDGDDNNTDNPASVKAKIMSSPHSRFAIGVEGSDYNVDKLKELASKNSNFVEAKSFGDLGNAFEFIGKQVSTIYTVDYQRSDQQISEPIKIKFKFFIDKQKF